MMRLDLHLHSSLSDGTLPPAEVIRAARRAGLGGVSLTDHDSIAGIPEAAAEAARQGLAFFPGVEINTREDDNLHVLGYGFDPSNRALEARLRDYRGRRLHRARIILEKLREAGLDLDLSELRPGGDGSIGRPHIAAALKRKRLVGSGREAFQKYLSKGMRAYVAPMGPGFREAVETIREAGGWAVFAHPGHMATEEVLARYAAWGLEGIEVYYPAHTGPVVERLLGYAERFSLVATGGSDFHGPGSGRGEIGVPPIPEGARARLLQRLGRQEE
jgi:predicted metal-dependent phosphoesterase TrpH